jgi:FMN phosphatase YigB (HAD superfamily)
MPTPTLTLTDFDTVTFDVYGTLIDWVPSITTFLLGWARQNGVKLCRRQRNLVPASRAVHHLDRRAVDERMNTENIPPDGGEIHAAVTGVTAFR